LKVTFLGTGTSQGIPVIGCDCNVCKSLDYRDKRFRTSIHLEANGVSLVVDTGPDFRMQMLRAGVKRLDAVLYTHEHKDHTAGLDDIRPFNFSQKMDMPIFGQKNRFWIRFEGNFLTSSAIKNTLVSLKYKRLKSPKIPFGSMAFPVIPIPVLHYMLPVLGFRFGDFSYITDANFIPDESLKLLEGTEILVLNALQKEAHISHFTLDEAVHMARKIGAKQTYFTHIAHRLGLHERIDRELPTGIALAYDGLELTLE
jgi:phosphoribosyl 1,2-cyclic phosphate phosphodiesterase